MNKTCFIGLIVLVSVGTATAEPGNEASSIRRGLITSASCPYSCRDAGVPAGMCRQIRIGDVCQIEDFTQPPGHRSMVRVRALEYLKQELAPASGPRAQMNLLSGQRGLVTSSSCPYNCRLAGLPRESCREWTDGDKCYIEDMTQPAGHRSRIPVPR